MLRRCEGTLPKWKKNYVDRGITVCPEWHTFETFVHDIGPCPDAMTLDRKDNAKGYSKGNCRWATRKVQQNNTTFNRHVEYLGEKLTLSQWCERLGLTRICLTHRLNRGWSLERAMTQPVQKKVFPPK
jgi:hypothetical protein